MRIHKPKYPVQTAVIVILVIILCIYNIPIPIQKSLSAIEINMEDASYTAERTVSVNGFYHINMFSKDRFSGEIAVSDYETLYENRAMDDVRIDEDGYPLTYGRSEDGGFLYFGTMYAGFMLKDMIIGFVYDKASGDNHSTSDCNVIATGVATRDEAYRLFEEAFYGDRRELGWTDL